MRKWKEASNKASLHSSIGNRRSLGRFSYHTYLIEPCDEEVVEERIDSHSFSMKLRISVAGSLSIPNAIV